MAERTKRLLFVDDDQCVLDVLAERLRKTGYVVTCAHDVETALACAGSGSFDLAILDVRLPDVSGIELAAFLRNQWGIPSMFLSANDEQSTVDMAIREGGMVYVVKPTTAEKLTPAIEAALARARDFKAMIDRAGQLEKALSTNRVTSIAIGILMAQMGLTQDEAFEQLRQRARRQRRKLEAVAEEVLKSVQPKTDGGAPGDGGGANPGA